MAGHAIHALATPYFQMTRTLDPFLLSVVITAPLSISILASPALGRLCDNLSAPGKKRLMRSAGWLAGLSFAMLWLAPETWSDAVSLWYLAAVCCLYYLAASVSNIALRSITYSTSQNSAQSLSVMAFAAFFERTAALFYFWLFPLAQLAMWGTLDTGIKGTGLLVGTLFIGLFTHIAAHFLPAGPTNTSAQAATATRNIQLSADVNRALLILLALIVIKLGFISAVTSLDFYLLVYFVEQGDIGEGAFWKGVLSSSFALFSLLLIPAFLKISMRVGALNTLVVIYSVSIAGSLAKWFIYAPGNQWWVVADAALGAASFVALTAIVPAMINQLSLHHTHQCGEQAHGFFAARQSQVTQASIVGALLLGGILLNVLGFDANLGGAQSDETLQAFRLVLAPGSAVLNILSLLLVLAYPRLSTGTLTQRQQQSKTIETPTCQQ